MKRAVFVGRWSPFHKGHMSIMKEKIDRGIPLLIFVRDTDYDIYPAQLRKRMIEAAMAKAKVNAKVEIIDDIESINYGRGVGYEVNEVDVEEDVKKISATEIRNRISNGDDSWREMMVPGADTVLHNYLSKKGVVVWLTGLSGAGKTTVANSVWDELKKLGIRTERLDGDILRENVTKSLGFSKEDRLENLRRASFLAKLLARNGVVVLASFITPYNEIQEEIRSDIEKQAQFVETYVNASIDECIKRDPKGNYKKALAGKIKGYTGIDDPFEAPKSPEIVLDTENTSVRECSKKLTDHILSLLNDQ
jgi:adenylylsulfate kinase